MRIAAIDAKLYRIPPTVPWEDATHHVSGLEFVIVQVFTEGGPVGVGFSYTTGIGGSAILALIRDYLAGMLIGENPQDVNRLWIFMNDQLHRCGTGGLNTLAMAAVDIALWDIVCQSYNLPLHKVLGASRPSIPAYVSGINLFMDEKALIDQMGTFLEQGFGAVKIKVGREDPQEDACRIAAVRSLIGPQRKLIVDANQKWNIAEAIPRLNLLRDSHPFWVEEPLHAEDIAGHSSLRRITGLPVAIGESLYTAYQFRDYLASEAVDIIQADVCRVGGITGWLEIAHLAAAYHRMMVPHFVPELSVSLLCGVPNGMLLEWVIGGSFTELQILQKPLLMKKGIVYPFEDSGHGIRFDFEKLSPYEISTAQLRELNLRSAK